LDTILTLRIFGDVADESDIIEAIKQAKKKKPKITSK
jgi:hypothetical protein